MELSQEKKTQIAACHGKGMTLSEISARSGLVEDVVAEFLESIGKTPNRSERRKITRLTQEQKKRIGELFSQGKGCAEISKSTGINIKTIEYYKKKLRKEKEPAAAATVTDSQKTDVVTDNSTVSISKDNIIEPKSQVLSPFTALTLLETLLDNWVGNEYEKYYMQAYEGDAEFIFIHEGRKYSFQFKECKEVVGE